MVSWEGSLKAGFEFGAVAALRVGVEIPGGLPSEVVDAESRAPARVDGALGLVIRIEIGADHVVVEMAQRVADGGEAPGIVYAEIDVGRVAKVRGMIPSLTHDREFSAV